MDTAGIGDTGPSGDRPHGLEVSRFAEIVQHLPVGVYIWRRREPARQGAFELVFANPASEAHVRRPAGEVLGRRIFDAFPYWRESPLASLFEEVLKDRADREVAELRLPEADGTTSSFSIKVFPLADESVVSTFENTTDLANERAKTERLEHQLLHAQKMEMVGRAAGGIAHDFNNLLTAVLGHSELVLEALGDDHPGRPGLERVREAGKRAAELTRRLLAVSRHQFSDPELLDFNQLVREHLALLRSMLGEDIDLRVALPDEPLLVMADQAQLGQVLLNLVVNAKDAMPEGGDLEISTAHQTVDQAEAVGEREGRAGVYVTLEVRNTGRGMDDEVLGKIFDPYFTTKSAEKGTGLGLPTVATIVKGSAGFVEVESAVDQGARFTVFLPRVTTEPAPPLGRAAEPVATPEGAGATVLVAEDEDMVRSLVTDLLTAHGYEVIEAIDADEALSLSLTHEGEIHLLISDVVMPRTSGIELARWLHETRPDLPVLLISGYTGEALDRGGGIPVDVELLRKPFTPGALLERVGDLVRRDAGPAPDAATAPDKAP